MVLEGLPIGIQGTTHCQWCDHEFSDGDSAIVLVAQPTGTDRWVVHRTYCPTCAPSAIASPVLSCAELLAECQLGTRADATQQPELVVLEPELIDSSGAVESQSLPEITDDEDPDTETQSTVNHDESAGVEIETLPPRLNVGSSHRYPVTSDSHGPTTDQSEEQSARSDGNTD